MKVQTQAAENKIKDTQQYSTRYEKFLQICSRCIYDETTKGIKFDSEGVCNYCRLTEQLEKEYKTGTDEGEEKFLEIVDKIKCSGKNKKYDCVLGVSGGTDSSYMLYKAVKLGLRPLAVHYDNTWNSSIATENIRKVLSKLNIDLYTHVVNNKESDDIFRSFLRASVPEIDGPTDIALTEVLYRAASKYGVKYILEGHSFRSEGISPLGAFYIDGRYIENIQKQFGNYKIDTFPNMKLLTFLKWILIKRIKKIRPLWYIKYSKEDAKVFLEKEFGWVYYGGHHLENRMTAFMHSYYLPKKFKNDQRNNSLSASVRSGKIAREKVLELYNKPPYLEDGLLEYSKKRLNLSDEEFERIMNLPPKSYKDYKTYKRTFEIMRPFFWLMYKLNLTPKSFYIKYTSKNEI
jgi:N-acetyl sugar amidotransferase